MTDAASSGELHSEEIKHANRKEGGGDVLVWTNSLYPFKKYPYNGKEILIIKIHYNRYTNVSECNIMDKYDPSIKPDSEEWLALDESERNALVADFHEGTDTDLDDDAMALHAIIHVVVENQIAMGVAEVERTIERLIRQGLSRHESIHAVGAVLTEDIYNLLKGNLQEFSMQRYRRKLEKLTAKRWRKGQW